MREFYDINEDKPNVGDIIVFSTGNRIAKAYVLGFTKMGMYISNCLNSNWSGQPLETHDGKKYKRWLSFMILERNKIIPDKLKHCCNLKQIPE